MKIKEWIKKRIFFDIDPDEKLYVRKNVMQDDHKIYLRMSILIAIFQVVMIFINVFKYNKVYTTEPKRLGYLICYCALLAAMIAFIPLLSYFRKKNKIKSYFILISLAVDVFFAWAAAISILDSFGHQDLTTYAYVTLALTAFMILEPWVYILDSILFAVILNVAIIFVPGAEGKNYVLISSLSILALSGLAAFFNFNRRVNSIFLQKHVNELNEKLNEMAIKDEVTHLYNRHYLTEHIENKPRIGKKPSGIMMIDIDDFKKLNDTYGHLSGDVILAELGSVINRFLKDYSGYAVRFGGEEFLIFIDSIDPNDFPLACEGLRKKIEDTEILVPDGDNLNVTVSVGGTLAFPGKNYSALINIADECLYQAKEKGKNKVVINKE